MDLILVDHWFYCTHLRTFNKPMRPKIDADENTRQQVRDYAMSHGLIMPEAWAQLVERGLDEVGEE